MTDSYRINGWLPVRRLDSIQQLIYDRLILQLFLVNEPEQKADNSSVLAWWRFPCHPKCVVWFIGKFALVWFYSVLDNAQIRAHSDRISIVADVALATWRKRQKTENQKLTDLLYGNCEAYYNTSNVYRSMRTSWSFISCDNPTAMSTFQMIWVILTDFEER